MRAQDDQASHLGGTADVRAKRGGGNRRTSEREWSGVEWSGIESTADLFFIGALARKQIGDEWPLLAVKDRGDRDPPTATEDISTGEIFFRGSQEHHRQVVEVAERTILRAPAAAGYGRRAATMMRLRTHCSPSCAESRDESSSIPTGHTPCILFRSPTPARSLPPVDMDIPPWPFPAVPVSSFRRACCWALLCNCAIAAFTNAAESLGCRRDGRHPASHVPFIGVLFGPDHHYN
ncbi:hypothetical protein PR202_gb11425 [Eleusine coracana subsp. coracana]|uniref:Uncharacterized protein n=1 Tax=Eleusine coracana subsp. coracana TaxID=191504 RepID=A0AAV5ELR4_ELECO|nr:hypothetical protein PR202_gb11425 [Eleusine coracana subsp. coracana]